MSFSHGRFQVT